VPSLSPWGPRMLPELDLAHLERLTDDVGILQHATFSIPNRHHGYCTDDNARALIVATRAQALPARHPRLAELATRYLAFVYHAFDRERRTFHNFMRYDRTWLPEQGSRDCHGRAVWALAVVASESKDSKHRTLAAEVFRNALPATESLRDLRAIAYSILGLDAYHRGLPEDRLATPLVDLLAGRLLSRFKRNGAKVWPWGENVLTYDNARLPHALLAGGRVLGRAEMVERGLGSLEWLLARQTVAGQFAPVANAGWYRRGGAMARFDQQPLEADGTIGACLEAYRATRDKRWLERGELCFRWFLGENDLGLPLYDEATGGCRDGLRDGSLNENQGAESTLAWLSSLIHMQTLRRPGKLSWPVAQLGQTIQASDDATSAGELRSKGAPRTRGVPKAAVAPSRRRRALADRSDGRAHPRHLP